MAPHSQYSCLENPMDRGAWWAAVCGVAQGQTRLKRLSSSSKLGAECTGERRKAVRKLKVSLSLSGLDTDFA